MEEKDNNKHIDRQKMLMDLGTKTAISSLRELARNKMSKSNHKGNYDPLPPEWIGKYDDDIYDWFACSGFSEDEYCRNQEITLTYDTTMTIKELLEFCFAQEAIEFMLLNAGNPYDFWQHVEQVVGTPVRGLLNFPISCAFVETALLSHRYWDRYEDWMEKSVPEFRTRLLSDNLDKVLTTEEILLLNRVNIVLYRGPNSRHIRGGGAKIDVLTLHPLIRTMLTSAATSKTDNSP